MKAFIHALPLLVFLHSASLIAADTEKQTYQVTMRDGTLLATDVYLPGGETPFPVLLARTPYNKDSSAGSGRDGAERGFAVVIQDTRGRFGSEGANLPFAADGWAEGEFDGVDTVNWILEQPWSNGRIGTFGGSAGAITQYLLAGAGATNVVGQFLVVGTASLYRDGIYTGGIFRKAMIEDWLSATRFAPEALDHWVTNHTFNGYWKDRDLEGRYEKVQAAGIHVGGWYDIFAQSTLDAFLNYQNHGGPGARGKQKLLMGPWTHAVLQPKVGELTFPKADQPPGELHNQWAWFNETLNKEGTILKDWPAVTYYTMGAVGEENAPGNEWRTAPQWPPVKTGSKRLYLHPDRNASFSRPNEPGSAEWTSNPEDSVPTIGGYQLTIPSGARDQQEIENREDLLVFTTRALETPLEVTGNVEADLWFRTDVSDADLVVRLCDVYPDGRSFNICEGALRLRFRNGLEREEMLEQGKDYRVRIKLWPTSMIFNTGHRLRIHIASSSFPALDPNLQNGRPPRSGEPRVGNHTLLLSPAKPSHLILPVPSED